MREYPVSKTASSGWLSQSEVAQACRFRVIRPLGAPYAPLIEDLVPQIITAT